jgi:hypothetical protein
VIGAVDLYWLPLGAGGHFVRLNGRVFEAVAAPAARRPTCDLYHSALEVRASSRTFVIEMTPIRDTHGGQRGVVAEGAVGSRWTAGSGSSGTDPPLARRSHLGRGGSRRKSTAPERRPGLRAARARPRAAGSDARLGLR